MKISLLQQMYKDVLAGIPLARESHHYSSLINLCVEQPPEGDESCHQQHLPSTAGGVGSCEDTDMSDVVPATDDLSNSFANMSSSFCPREVMLLQLTLIKMMVAKAESQEIELHTRQKYCEIFVLLLKEAKIDSKLIHLLGSDDRLLSHMASQSLASLVYFQLKEEDALNVPWLSFSLAALLGFPGKARVPACLCTLAALLKETLKDAPGARAGVLKKLLAPLDAVLEGFYNAILLHHFDSHHYTSPYSEAANNLISFIDLLEALLVSRTELEVPLRCQRILFLKVSYALNVISSSVPYVIKKKFILLLKKCVLYKSREDAKSGSAFLQTPSLCEDMLALSNVVLQVVNLTWLNQIPLSGKSSYFGSSETAPGHDSQGASDQTVLRALSLVVLKALEFKIHNSQTEAEIKGDFESSMSQLLMFWRSHVKPSPQSHPAGHHCEWLSLVFMEQDDDMWEAAKALLLIYLKFDRLRRGAADNLSQKEEESWQFLVHAGGYNPHCIFLFFLEKIAFDSTVLLDFLISSETCFLEYLVRYLKLLGKEWHQFVDVCNHFDTRHSTFRPLCSVKPPHQEKQNLVAGESLQNALCAAEPQTPKALAPSHNCPVFTAQQGDNEAAEWNQSDSLTGTDSTALPGSLQSLVNYDSSEDSEVESDGKECLVNTKQLPSNNEGEVRRRETGCGCGDDDQNPCTSEVLPPKPKGSPPSSCWTCMAPPDNTAPLRVMLYKSTKCLEELQEAVSRLQRRNLFPYNPSALLKLLGHVEKMSKSTNPQ
ncbi:protein Lines homolog 1 isoform X1 [Passer montanus]|uniref:protein Lines homolog 1 isoform X1 n=2 Tax=Passer montanus TaxID=9160 RepID=UPI00195F3054|nr:protein Lines homolog 1 isoform X1 [Passer montanus]XP_039579278.1 protein Lines homolog 1 isoform X1 [Passer montanus]XP_039579279.1 protein Lines homolog 1 isoform X1 [Passer montanus]XP_039579280.1 protein Lines homolog 1 isoform X1 [Passer montanus]XP_039579281.1 protein Lines homolog 1 isoform X1 [Passer montanus]